MTDRSIDGLRACISSIDKIIGPAVEAAGDKLAAEQVHLVSKYLSFLAERLPLTGWRSRVELEDAVRQGEQVAAAVGDGDAPVVVEAAAHLRAQVAAARERLSGAEVAAADLEAGTAAVRTAVSLLVRLAGAEDTASRAEVRRLVVETSRPYVDLQRAWFAPQRWEDDATAVPDLEVIRSERAAV